jgi:hypothetical protein
MKGIFGTMLLAIGSCACAQNNPVADWAAIVQPAVHNAAAPRSPGSSEILHTIVHLAVYDAVVAVEGGYRPYAAPMRHPREADVRAAVAAAAYRIARSRVAPSQVGYLDAQYELYLARIPNGPAKAAGIQVGESAAAAVLRVRANDGLDEVVLYQCTSTPPPPGEFEPNGGCGTQPVDANLGHVKPFTFANPSRFRPAGPNPLRSMAYLEDFTETRNFGAVDSSARSPEQTDIAYFWSEHTYVHWNRNLINLALSRGLDARDTARLFAMAHTAASDAIIAGFAAKYFYRTWRPRTAIPQADTDGNPDTDPDPSWKPLLTVNHPEYPSAHGFWSTALLEAVAQFFGTSRVAWTLTTSQAAVPQLIQTTRTYPDLSSILREIENARVWSGLHWRHSMRDGEWVGLKVARHVLDQFFCREDD